MKKLYQHGKLSLALLLACTFLLIYLTDRFVLTFEFYKGSGEPLSGVPGQGSGNYLTLQKWVYLSSAAYLLLKLGVVSIILHTALYLRERAVPYSDIFRVVTVAEFVFLIPAAVKLLSFNYTFQHGNLLDWHRYFILSALSLFRDVPADWFFALQSVNIFEPIYWLLLAAGVSHLTVQSFVEALITVLTSYVPAFVIWVVSVTFFTLMMFPATG